ncbi:uncharacterized protein B0H64DRAFT_188882 [Chaetomium fimeti]|uniref:Secreted protein n=1 Tax=Chaetomium fimeti TaxID=1854472 RepID=A0AAE0LRE6_9PEZI|nr:hypothetical protein B0H64DRAFT_188882 [Chaetomium fimeti]
MKSMLIHSINFILAIGYIHGHATKPCHAIDGEDSGKQGESAPAREGELVSWQLGWCFWGASPFGAARLSPSPRMRVLPSPLCMYKSCRMRRSFTEECFSHDQKRHLGIPFSLIPASCPFLINTKLHSLL